MQRYFVPAGSWEDNRVFLKDDDAKHISKVMRMQPGDNIICCDNNGRSAVCEIHDLSGNVVEAHVLNDLESDSEMPVSVTIAQGLPKADKLEYIVQKGTELGASTFFPFSADRSVVKWDEKKAAKKKERLEKIAKEAAEQSQRSKIPEILNPGSFSDLLNVANQYNIKIVAYEEEAKQHEYSRFSSALKKLAIGDNLLCVIGPEGGLSENEARILKEHGFELCGLGPRILRTETAPLYILSAISYHFELKG
ncbi:16S rRNA (uracil(1498)-N(3))-methyltransferase [Fictibacillus phosphorivorans]|uniref:16S rRNA (uracil(1498)-N(3))-methyltransferase n=1 Tax=Fictibacillus phosphorivorans TaxID=1221500 RepID=UPI002040EF4F|nr:16S rRNA (uracil(1498)-N(3))-methyltransferase [Fictibacillus phosphorivorans]MCM3716877.1 16S rRNA (uracil(1498)-N(3))-methyltransferase [Fictibacillus phosphorivorans]MCM3774574.1 16S rRNA (uracil(1498)-N(3))-methyltransferase [Fictibacillus phosphorivorans]